MKSFKFTVPGAVVPQARPRATKVAGNIVMHDTRKCQSYKMDVASCASMQIERQCIEVPVIPNAEGFTVRIIIHKGFLKSMSKKKIGLARENKIRPVAKPDLDNAAKGILDAMKGVFWKDDSAVTILVVEKMYDDMDFTEVEIYWEEPEEK